MSERAYEPGSQEHMEREAHVWDAGQAPTEGWRDAPDAVPRGSTLISLRVPNEMLAILKEFARREGVGYQVLMKRWVDDRMRQERSELAKRRAAS